MRSTIILFIFNCLLSPHFSRANDSVPAQIRQCHTDEFCQEEEFPRYFLKKDFRKISPALVPAAEVAKAKDLVAKALGSVLRRLTVPLVKEGESKVTMVPYFNYIHTHLQTIDPSVKVMPSGGVIRAALAYLYAELYQKIHIEGSTLETEEILSQMIASTAALPGLQVRGIGSDLDVLLIAGNPELFKLCQEWATKITSSAETHHGFREANNSLKRALFTIPDFKDYLSQTIRSTQQGGSSVDFLAFDLMTDSFIEPPYFEGIVDDLLRGVYSYLPPADPSKVEDFDKQAVRGARPLVELPFIAIKDDRTLRHELEQLKARIMHGHALSPKAMEQFPKIVRNARFSGANNRFYRRQSGSVESLFLEISQLAKRDPGNPLIPEFVDNFNLDSREPRGKASTLDDLLMDHREFNGRFHGGRLYHGTPNAENALAILRMGLFLSTDQQGTAALGRGAYLSPQREVSQDYAGAHGVVFELQVKNDPRVRILDWERHRHDPRMMAIAEQANSLGKDVFEVLSREYQIDVIINHHVLLQNMDAIEIQGGYRAIFDTYWQTLSRTHSTIEEKFKAFKNYNSLYSYALALGESSIPEPPSLNDFLHDALIAIQSPAVTTEEAARALPGYSPQKAFESLVELRRHDATDSFIRALGDPMFVPVLGQFIEPLGEILRTNKYYWGAIRNARDLRLHFPDSVQVQKLADEISRKNLFLLDDDKNIHLREIARDFLIMSPELPEVLVAFEQWLTGPDRELQSMAMELLVKSGNSQERFIHIISEIYEKGGSIDSWDFLPEFLRELGDKWDQNAFNLISAVILSAEKPLKMRTALIESMATAWKERFDVKPFLERLFRDQSMKTEVRLSAYAELIKNKLTDGGEHFPELIGILSSYNGNNEYWKMMAGFGFEKYAQSHSQDAEVKAAFDKIRFDDDDWVPIARTQYSGVNLKVPSRWAADVAEDIARRLAKNGNRHQGFLFFLRPQLGPRRDSVFEPASLHKYMQSPPEDLCVEGLRFLAGRQNKFISNLFHYIDRSTDDSLLAPFESELRSLLVTNGAKAALIEWFSPSLNLSNFSLGQRSELLSLLALLNEGADIRVRDQIRQIFYTDDQYRNQDHDAYCARFLTGDKR